MGQVDMGQMASLDRNCPVGKKAKSLSTQQLEHACQCRFLIESILAGESMSTEPFQAQAHHVVGQAYI